MASRSRIILEEWLKTIKLKNKKIGDVGGSQKSIVGRVKMENCSVFEYDLPDYDLNEAWLDREIQDEFDVVFCLEVFEYLYEPDMALKNIRWMLKDEGVLYLSTHYLYGLHKPDGTDFMRLTYYGIEKLLKINGFEIEEVVKRDLSSAGREMLYQLYRFEEMKILNNEYTFDSGYLIKAKKGKLPE